MRLLTISLLLVMCGSAAAQKVKQDESDFLKALAGAAGAASVAEAKAGTLSGGEPLRVYVLAPGQADVSKFFREWVEEWNRTEGGRHGRVEVVGDAARADVILARFLTRFKEAGRGAPVGEHEPLGHASTPPKIPITPFPGAAATATPSEVARSYYSAKAYCYVAAREGGGLRLLWRGSDAVRVRPSEIRSTDDLAFQKGEKDSKFVGDRLRDRFFKLLRARRQPPATSRRPADQH